MKAKPLAGAVVDTNWLAAHLDDPNVRVLDGSWHLPTAQRDPRAEFAAEHLPGAQFFDIDGIADRTTNLPHMLPSAEEFARAVGALGVGDRHHVVVYDTAGVFSAPRVWWTFRAFGHDAISILDGGLPKWKREQRPTTQEVKAPAVEEFTAKLRPQLVRSREDVRANLDARREQVLDARSRGRFEGTAPEPRKGVRGGRIPDSKNLPFDRLISEQGTLRSAADVERELANVGIDRERPVVTLCGSGITACVLALGLHLTGAERVAVYDGSWTEWGGAQDTPVITGPAD
jgi:thiosulfate/3-mercaptopyruvate sulfurtransferase